MEISILFFFEPFPNFFFFSKVKMYSSCSADRTNVCPCRAIYSLCAKEKSSRIKRKEEERKRMEDTKTV